MQLSNEIRTVPAKSIRADGAHLFWAAEPDEELTESIREFGQAAPILVHNTDQGLELVAGYRRLMILEDKKMLALARIISSKSDLELGLLYLADNSRRVLDDGMRLAALRYFRPLMDDKALKNDMLPRLGIKPKSKDGKLLLAWLDMPENWQAHLTAGRLPLAAGTTLARMDDAARAAVEPLFTQITWSRSNAVNLLTWLFETGKMTDTPVAEVMAGAGINDTLAMGLSPKDAIAKLTTAARLARYPYLTALQDEFTRAASELGAGTAWRVIQPNNFETGGAELTIQVKDAAHLAKAVKDLETMAGLSPWETIWQLGGKHD